MNFPFVVARRYFLSKKKRNFINVIAIISMLVVAVGTTALITALSVYNGLEDVLKNIHSNFDPDIKVMPMEGKSFPDSLVNIAALKETAGIRTVSGVIENKALIKYKGGQRFITVKGVGKNFFTSNGLHEYIIEDDYKLTEGKTDYAILGVGVKYMLDIDGEANVKPLTLYYPKNLTKFSMRPDRLYTTKSAMLGGTFALERQYDDNYVFVSTESARKLFSYDGRLSYLEINITDERNSDEVVARLQEQLGTNFKVLTREQIHAGLYQILKIEKLIVFIILSLIVSIASINIYFSLSMLVLDKKKDISILYTLGATTDMIRKIFLFEGAIITFAGLSTGLVLGLTVSYLQKYFGIIKMSAQSSLSPAYPVKVEFHDIIYTIICIAVITLLASIQPARLAAKSFSNTEL
ncbi:MAG: FtsX-like permease family protein [Cyclobacteriaceae bacterium]